MMLPFAVLQMFWFWLVLLFWIFFFLISNGSLLLRSCAINLTERVWVPWQPCNWLDIISLKGHSMLYRVLFPCLSSILDRLFCFVQFQTLGLNLECFLFCKWKLYFILSIIYCTQQLLLWCIRNGLSWLICLHWTTASGMVSPCISVLSAQVWGFGIPRHARWGDRGGREESYRPCSSSWLLLILLLIPGELCRWKAGQDVPGD